jgi:hypothetical protein
LKRLRNGRAHPVPDSVTKSDSLELQVIWEYLGHDPPLNCRRTLDQYGYPSLRDTRSRDDDQMLYKLTKDRMYLPGQQRDLYSQWSSNRTSSDRSGGSSWRAQLPRPATDEDAEKPPEEKVLNGNVLMVDQLWLWVIDQRTCGICFPIKKCEAEM